MLGVVQLTVGMVMLGLVMILGVAVMLAMIGILGHGGGVGRDDVCLRTW